MLNGNMDLLTVGAVMAMIGIFGAVLLFTNSKSATNRVFFSLSMISILWSITNYFSYQAVGPETALWLIRIVFFFASWFAFLLFLLAFVFPNDVVKFTKRVRAMAYATIVISIATLTPAFVREVNSIADITGIGEVSSITPGFGMPLFGFFVFGLFIYSAYIFIRKALQSSDLESRKQYLTITTGLFVTWILLIVFNYIFPTFIGNTSFVPLGALFIFPFIFSVFYSVYKHNLFNIKIFASLLFTVLLSVITLLEVIFSETTLQLFFRISIFVSVLVFGVLLLRSVVREVRQREKIEELAKSLEKANARLQELDRLKSEFVSIASHQLRSPLTAIKGYASLVLEGSFGTINDSVREAIQKIFDSSKLMAVSVQDFLDVSKIEQGKMHYDFEDFDLEKLLRTVVEELTHTAKEKKLNLTLKITSDSSYRVHADMGKIKQVLYNLIDNSIKYTPDGSVNVLMHYVEGKIRVEIHDTGVGIAKETLPKLFEKFVRSRNAHHVNVSGSGLGLFVVKQMVEAHKGKVWATSEGEGRGSVFHVELESVNKTKFT